MTRARRRARAAVALAAVAVAVACGSTSTDTPHPTTTVAPPRIRVMTWNLQRGQAVSGALAAADMAPFAALVATDRADVVGLQEVTRQQADDISRILGWSAPAYVETKRPCPGFPAPLPASCVPFGNAILSRHPLGPADHWLLPASRLEASLEDRILLRSVVDAGATRLSVFVTHLASNATEAEREAQVREVLAHVDDDRSVLLADLNADPTDDVVRLARSQFVDAWDERRLDDDGDTSNAVLGLVERIDYVLVGRDSGLGVTEVDVDPTVLSDHLAVVAELAA